MPTIRRTTTSRMVASADGTLINYQTAGQGPSAIVIPGVLSTAADYASLVDALADTYTVHVIERRGRGVSGPQGNGYSIAKECDDIGAIQQETNATLLFGHSYGGLIALEVARSNRAFSKLAVYEPGVSIGGSISMAWMPAYQRCLAAKHQLDAMVEFSIGAGPESTRTVPRWLMKLVLPLIIRGRRRQQMFDLLPANLLEHKEVARLDGTYRNYQQITARALLMFGGKSRLKWVISQSRRSRKDAPSCDARELPNLDHFGPDDRDAAGSRTRRLRFFLQLVRTTRPRLRPTAYWRLA